MANSIPTEWSRVVAEHDVTTEPLELGGTPSRQLTITRVANVNALVDRVTDEEMAVDDRLPYWANLWPSAVALARWIFTRPKIFGPVIELGAGLGVPSLAVAARRIDVVATDYEPDALAFATHNAVQNRLKIGARVLDFREFTEFRERFATVIAADVLYEPQLIEPLATAADTLLQSDGRVWVADPGRPDRNTFIRAMKARKFDIEETTFEDVTIMVCHRR